MGFYIIIMENWVNLEKTLSLLVRVLSSGGVGPGLGGDGELGSK